MKMFNWGTIRLILMFGLVVFLFSFTSKRNIDRKVKKTEVVFVGENALFLKSETVDKLLIENKSNLETLTKDKLDLNKIEQLLNAHEMVEKADVYVSIDGVLKAVVKQKTPIVRVFNGKDSFYIDYEGYTMPLSQNYSARVPLVSGEINKKNNKNLFELFKLIHDDAFLKKNIIGIKIMPNGSLLMLNRNYKYLIDFGGTINVERKFRNYKAFFQKVSLDSSLNNYKKIDLRFADQVVCTK
jgi:cell division protein FtsQ